MLDREDNLGIGGGQGPLYVTGTCCVVKNYIEKPGFEYIPKFFGAIIDNEHACRVGTGHDQTYPLLKETW